METFFSDPVHGRIDIPDTFKELMGSRVMTRLRNIRQLGFTPSVYAGAVHTRFEHTIGKTAVLIKLLDQFQVRDDGLRQRYIRASLLSEIGTYPLSYSTSWFFRRVVGMSKSDYARLLCDTYVTSIFSLSDSDKHFIWEPNDEAHIWFQNMPAIRQFPHLGIMKLAGDIDYAMRDGHYSGRYSNSFDFRYFSTLVEITDHSCQQELAESIRELYRSIYSLNSVYGDVVRRFITLVFVRLVSFLVAQKFFRISSYKDAPTYVELDDDRFMSDLSGATSDAAKTGIAWPTRMLRIINQLEPTHIRSLERTPELADLSLHQIEQEIAKRESVESDCVIAINDGCVNDLGYVLFGTHFNCYKDAIDSDYFTQMTGLQEGSNRTGLLNDKSIYYTVV
jgi:HD superfamily phosphohydrolase